MRSQWSGNVCILWRREAWCFQPSACLLSLFPFLSLPAHPNPPSHLQWVGRKKAWQHIERFESFWLEDCSPTTAIPGGVFLPVFCFCFSPLSFLFLELLAFKQNSRIRILSGLQTKARLDFPYVGPPLMGKGNRKHFPSLSCHDIWKIIVSFNYIMVECCI